MTEDKFTIYRPFSPPIGKTRLPLELINDLNNYVETVINDEKLAENMNHGNYLAGQVTQEFRVSKDFLDRIKWLINLLKIH